MVQAAEKANIVGKDPAIATELELARQGILVRALMADYLKTDEDVANYLTLVLADKDPAELRHALGTIARARGMSDVALASGLTREALYKALRPNSQPRFDTIARVCTALGVKLVAQPAAA